MYRKWWLSLALVIVCGLCTVVFMGIRTYQDAPPIPDFKNERGEIVVSHESILNGQLLFQKYALMDYGSMFGDGAGRGPDYTADALQELCTAATEYYKHESAQKTPDKDSKGQIPESAAINAMVREDLKNNRYNKDENSVVLPKSLASAKPVLDSHYVELFDSDKKESMRPRSYISDRTEIKNLSSFFFWGAWVCSCKRPGKSYSYTHNWPYNEAAGNTPSAPILFWSVAGCFGFFAGLAAVLYLRGSNLQTGSSVDDMKTLMNKDHIANFQAGPMQRATYKFFAVAAVLFLVQILSGVLTIHDFVLFTNFGGVDISRYLPITISRAWHLQLSLLWITACWIGASLFVAPILAAKEVPGNKRLTNILFLLLALTVAGTLAGVYLGPTGKISQWYLLGNQGWEFVELGKLWQGMLFLCLGLWSLILYRSLRSSLREAHPIALPNWLFYSVLCVLVLFISGFVAEPTSNFVVADFWRWCVIHMWVEAFFEVFTTALIASFMYLMGLVSFNAATRTVYISTLLFLGSGIIGISHNFYWNAKPVETLALGSVFSTLQVVPLLLLTLEAWNLARAPQSKSKEARSPVSDFAHSDTYLFLLGVNFWNFCGAGLFGFIINLPIVNYYEHGTYLTVNHGHAALMGVYGNLAIAAMLFCLRFMIKVESWNSSLIRTAFWSLNCGLMLMVLLDLFPAGLLQLSAVLENGLHYARSQEFILSSRFQALTWMRIAGGAIFLTGGVIPLCIFVLTAERKRAQGGENQETSMGSPEYSADAEVPS